MSTPELIAYLPFAVYLVGFLALTRAVTRSGTDPWLFARGGGVQILTGWTFRIGFALLLVIPLVHIVTPGLAMRLGAWPLPIAIAGATLAVSGAALALRAQVRMGSAWRIGASEGRVGRLVIDGPFAWSRNPVFLGQIALVWGMFLASGDAFVGIVASAVTLAAVAQASVEEGVLLASLGEDYRNYCARVPRWLGWPRGFGARR
jgi:protein-S-isoprenylcysteine O-methyltransferase Ste14